MKNKNISRRNFVKATAAASLAPACLLSQPLTARNRTRQPNIVLIMADDLGYECLGANGGSSYRTPVLDRLAAEGLRFEHCYAQPVCTPTRVQLMTGMYNVRNYVRFGILPRNETTFAHLLRESGYATCVVGKWQLGKQLDSPKHAGFDESCLWQHTRGRTGAAGTDSRYANPSLEINGQPVDHSGGEYGPDVVSDFACDFMERNKNQPFLLYYPMILTHCPFGPTPDSPNWDPNSMGSESYKGEAKYFGDMVAYMDKLVGKIVKTLDDLGLRDNTLVLFTGDNGTDEPVVSELNGRLVAGGKKKTTDAGTRVPMIANWPQHTPEGRVSSGLLDLSDFFPTLCDVAGAAIPSELTIDGRSFLPQIRGERGNPRDWIYSWYSFDGITDESREFARNQRHKLYRTGEFYDIQVDELEKHNLQNTDLDEETQRIRAMLQQALDQYKDARPPELMAR